MDVTRSATRPRTSPRAARVALCALALLALLAPAGMAAVPAGAGPTIIAAPGGWLTQYATPAMVTGAGAGLFLRNEDIMRHDVVSEAYGPDGQAWCLDQPLGRCPLLWTPLIDRGATVAVSGLANTLPGTQYAFYCTLHTAMRGTIVTAPATP